MQIVYLNKSLGGGIKFKKIGVIMFYELTPFCVQFFSMVILKLGLNKAGMMEIWEQSFQGYHWESEIPPRKVTYNHIQIQLDTFN